MISPGAVDVGEEHVERPDALLEALGELPPFGLGEHPRDDVEGDDAFLGVLVAVDREGDADPAEEELRLEPAVGEGLGGFRVEPALDQLIAGTAGAVGQAHLVKWRRHDSLSAARGPVKPSLS